MKQKELVEKIVGKLLFKEILRIYHQAAIKSGLLIIEGFEDAEVFFATKELSQNQDIKVRITDKLHSLNYQTNLDSKYFFTDQETLALNRSEARNDFRVIFVMSEQSDRNSVTSMLKKNDDNILDSSLKELKFDNLIEAAWENFFDTSCLPVFKKCANFYLESLLSQKVWDNPLLRPSTRFLVQTLSQIVNIDVISQADIEQSLAQALPELGMFSDIHCAKLNLSKSVHASRIKENYYGSNLYRPDGSVFDKDKLINDIQAIRFKNPDSSDEEFDLETNQLWQEKCISFIENHPAINTKIFEEIPWAIISQIFTAKSKVKLKLGGEIRNFLIESAPGREEEFDNLTIETDLDKGSSTAAEKLIEEKSSITGEDSLFDLLADSSANLQTRVRNLAAKKGRKVENFLPWLINEIDEVRQLSSNNLKLVLKPIQKSVEAGKNDFTLRLFAFLFGGTLKQISKEAGKLIKFELDCDHSLLTFEKLSIDDFNDETKDYWPDLEIFFEFYDVDDGSTLLNAPQKVLWSPNGFEMLKAFFVMCCDRQASEVLAWKANEKIEWWANCLSRGNISCAENSVLTHQDVTSLEKVSGEAGGEWVRARKSFIQKISESGLSTESCTRFFEKWSSENILGLANSNEFQLSGTPLLEFNNFMRIDTFLGHGEIAVLPTHPLKVRWIGDYLCEMKNHALKAMAPGGLDLVDANREFFHKRINNLSPSQIPPYFVLREESGCETYLPTSEFGWGEIYKPISTERKEGNIDFDDLSIKAIAEECHTFIKHHKYKIRGTDILIVLDRPGKFPEKFLKCFYGSSVQKNAPRLRLHLLAESEVLSQLDILRKQEGAIFEHLEDYQMSPFIDITAHKWDDKKKLPQTIRQDSIDITIVPELFGSSVEQQSQNNEDPESDDKAFRSLYSKPVILGSSPAGGNASIIMLPESQDEALYQWSNLSVRLKRNGALTKPMRGTDSLSLIIELYSASDLMSKLHRVSLWVVTLDKFLSRSNIENLECKPEIISYKTNVGSSGAYNLIISAEMGKKFIEPRLINKIDFLNKNYFSGRLTDGEIQKIATALFVESKGLAPSVVLRSLGGGWAINELMGLVCTKRYINRSKNNYDLTVWIPLDHNFHWFGGGNTIKRADLLLLCGKYFNDNLILEFTVIESKFGRKELAKEGTRQALESYKVLSTAFVGYNSGVEKSAKADSRLWNQSLLEAIQASGVCEGKAFQDGYLAHDYKDDILTGRYKTEFKKPIVLCHSPEEVDTPIDEDEGQVSCIYLDANSILGLLLNEEYFDNSASGFTEPEVGFNEQKVEATELESKSNESDLKKEEVEVDFHADEESEKGSLQGNKAESSSADCSEFHPLMFSKISDERKKAMYQKLISYLNDQVDKTIRSANKNEGIGIVEGPSSIRFQIRNQLVPPQTKIESKLAEIGILFELPEGMNPNVYRDGPLWISIPKKKDEIEPFMGSQLQGLFESSQKELSSSGSLSIPLGIDLNGNISHIDLSSSQSPHMLIAGTSGGGKSVAVKTLIRSCVNNYKPSQVELSLIDPKGDYRSLSKLPNFGDRYYNIGMKDRWLEVLQKTEKLIYDRINKIESSDVDTMDIKAFNKKYPEQAIPRHVLIIDECHNVMLTDDKPNREEISCIKKIGREGRALGVHLVLSTQRPSRTVIDGDIKANFPAVLGLRVDNDINSRIIIGENGLEKLAGNGDAIFKNGDGRLIRMQVAIFDEDIV